MVFEVACRLRQADFTLDVALSLPLAGVTALYGPSGSGKTSLLRVMAGLMRPDGARIRFGDQIWQGVGAFVPPHKRPVGFVFQESSLLPHLSVERNLAYGMTRAARPASPAQHDHIVDLLGIGRLLDRMPGQLSGGESQRVAIARALVISPALLLMDEPMAALDMARRREILGYLERLKCELKIPLVYVSHNIAEVTRLADHLVVLEAGAVRAQGPIRQLIATQDIPGYLGAEPFSLLFGRVSAPATAHDLTEVMVGDLCFRMPRQPVTRGAEIRLHLYARDVSLALRRPEQSSVLNIFPARIAALEPAGADGQRLVHLVQGDLRIAALLSAYSCAELDLRPGQTVFTQIKALSIVQ